MMIRALDAHCHADILMRHLPSFPNLYREMGCGCVTWAYLETAHSREEYIPYWNGLRNLCRAVESSESPFYYLVGIHPRSITEDMKSLPELPAELCESLAEHLRDPLCLGLGELGLDKGGRIEEQVLLWQLDWAVRHLPEAKRIGVHTPRQRKEEATRRTLDILDDFKPLASRLLIDHVTPALWPMVSEKPYWMGMTLQDGKVSLDELISFAAACPSFSDRIIVNSDGAKALSRPFLDFLRREELLDAECRRAVLRDNALRFYGLSLGRADDGLQCGSQINEGSDHEKR